MKLEHHPNVFPKQQILDMFGITGRQLEHWTDHVFTREKVSEQLKYNFRDLCMLACIVHLREKLGLSIQKIRSDCMPYIELGVNRARSTGKSIAEIKVTWWSELLFVYSGEVYMPLADWQKGTVDFKEIWDEVRGIKIRSRELQQEFE